MGLCYHPQFAAPSTSLMHEDPSHDIPYDPAMPYDRDEPPEYASPPLGRDDSREGDEVPLLIRRKGEGGTGSTSTVDEFAYELGRVQHDLKSLRLNLDGIPPLYSAAIVLSPSDASAAELAPLQDLAAQTTATSLLLTSTIPALRVYAAKLPYLKPAAGNFVVSTAEQTSLKHQLADCCDALKASLGEISKWEKHEASELPQAKERLMKVIKTREPDSGADQVMAKLWQAQRDGEGPLANLTAESYSWRWAVEHPASQLALAIHKAGDTAFLNNIARPSTLAPSLWTNPFAYVSAIPGSRKSSGYSIPGTKEALPVDGSQEEVGPFGEPVEGRAAPPRRRVVWLWIAFVLLLLAGASVGIALWSLKTDHATASTEGADSQAGATVILPALCSLFTPPALGGDDIKMPFHVQHSYHSGFLWDVNQTDLPGDRYTVIPKVLYIHRQGMKRWRVTFGPGERLAWTPN
ncbi:hypothetical protein JCM5296_000106 [Sporobolomyces johnsonii]